MDVVDELPDIDSLWNYDEAAETEAAFRAVIPAASESGRTSYLAELFTQIARTEGLQGRFSDAEEDIQRAEGLIGPDDVRPRIRALLERGRVLNSSGNGSDSKSFFLEAFELAVEAREEFLAIDAAHMLGIVEEPDAQLEWSLTALDMAKSAADERASGWQGSLHNNIGWSYHDLGRYEDALRHFEAGLAFQKGRGRGAHARIASWTVGRCLRSLGRADEALAIQEANLEAVTNARAPDGFVEEELGECLLALAREIESRPHFQRAFESLSGDSWLVEHEPERLGRIRRLADIPAVP